MIGNAVPVNLSYAIAKVIYEDLFSSNQDVKKNKMYNRSLEPIQLELTLF
jgi:hypothetical protein